MRFIKEFLHLESSTGILLIICAVLAIVCKNSGLESFYDAFLSYQLNVDIFTLSLHKPLVIWVNDLLMAFFFFMIGLELKRELLEGHLSTRANCILPGMAALGGILFPALIYVSLNYSSEIAIQGWAIPTATDIAFALGVLALLGDKISRGLKICLLSLAIFDDLAAIIIISIFYTAHISLYWLTLSLGPILVLFLLNISRCKWISLYLAIGLLLWICILKSGVHATISGVILAAFIPNQISEVKYSFSPLKTLEKNLHPLVSFLILPIFAFCNAGVPIKNLSLTDITNPIALGIMLGLFLGKQCGVMLFSYVSIKMGLCQLPANTNYRQFYGMAVLTGIGFTMSLFIGSLSFDEPQYQDIMRLGVLSGSLISGIVGYLILRNAINRHRKSESVLIEY